MINDYQTLINRKTRIQKKINEEPKYEKLKEIYKKINQINLSYENDRYNSYIKKELIFEESMIKLNQFLKENKIYDYWSQVLINSKLYPNNNEIYISLIKYVNITYISNENNKLLEKVFKFTFKKNDYFYNKEIKISIKFIKEEFHKIISDKFNFKNNININETIFEEIPYRKSSFTKYFKKKTSHILFFNIFKDRELDYSNSDELIDNFDSINKYDNKDLSFIEIEQFFIKLEDIINQNYFYYKDYKTLKKKILNENKIINNLKIENEKKKDWDEMKEYKENRESECILQ